MGVLGAMILSLSCLMLQTADGELDYFSNRQGMKQHGDFIIAGFFPLHYGHEPSGHLPALSPCNQ